MLRKRLVAAWRRLSIQPAVKPFTERRICWQWERAGRPVPPPPLVKQAIVRHYQRAFDLRVFVETGTFAGEMTAVMAASVPRVVSIELDPALHARAVERFHHDKHVELLLGDSGVRLPEVVATLHEPALFWLDAHYSGPATARAALDSPIAAELRAIHASPVQGHVVLIDDMRDFTGTGGYPRADELLAWLESIDPGRSTEIRDDILRWHPRTGGAPVDPQVAYSRGLA